MIIDKLENISLYKNIPECVVDFVKSLHKNISTGKHILSETIYANIEEYHTKLLKDAKFEAHNKYIDIQILLDGREQIFVTDRKKLTESIPYNQDKDIIFYADSVIDHQPIFLDGTNFVVLYPHEAHAPQVAIAEKPEKVLKVVIKIKLEQ